MPDDEVRVPTGLTTDGIIGKRYVAHMIDTFVAAILFVFAMIAISLVAGDLMNRKPITLTFGILLLVQVSYFAVMESSSWQATFGKRVFGLKVYRLDGGRMSFGQAALRSAVRDVPLTLLQSIPLLSLLCLLAHIFVLHQSPVNQAIHDGIAKTWVAAPEETTQLRLT